MGKVKKATDKAAVAVAPDVLQKVTSLKDEATQLFMKKDFAKASETYDQAVKLLPDGAADKPELLYKKTGCLLQLKKFKEAAKEASAVLELAPGHTNALKARAKASEALGLFKQALGDIVTLNRTEAASGDTQESERRLRDLIAGRGPRPGSAPSAGAPSSAARAAAASPNAFHITIKATCESESKLIYASLSINYAELLEAVRAKFPTAGPVALKYVDKDGDLVTIASQRDIQVAFQELAVAFQRQMAGSHAPKLMQAGGLPPLKLVVQKVASEAEVPRPPPEETGVQVVGGPKDAAPQPQYEVDEWILNFARTLTDVTGLDPSSHADQAGQGQDALTRAVQDTLASDAAGPLLDSAAASFRDAAVSAIIQWGNVHILRADRLLQKLQKEGKTPWGKGSEFDAVMAEYDATQKKVEDALRLKPDSWEAVGSLAQVDWERAKARMGYVLQPAPGGDQEALSAQLKEVLAKVAKDSVKKVEGLLNSCTKTFDKALGLAKAAQAEKEARDKAAGKEEAKEVDPAAAMSTPTANVLVMHGNILYDWSQVLAVSGASPWRPVLDAATAKFRDSGAAEADIRNALKNHVRASELDLGPDPEPEPAPAPPAPAAPAPAAKSEEKKEEKKAPEAKGLPSLDIKKAAKK